MDALTYSPQVFPIHPLKLHALQAALKPPGVHNKSNVDHAQALHEVDGFHVNNFDKRNQMFVCIIVAEHPPEFFLDLLG